MQTIFKVGMKVYDQINFPDKEGKIEETNSKKIEDYPLLVIVGDELFYYTEQGSRERNGLKTLSTSPYKVELQGFEQKVPVPTFEEAYNFEKNKGNYSYSPCDFEVPASVGFEAVRAFLKLLFLRDYYNEGWQPNWKDNKSKYSISCVECELCEDFETTVQNALTFKTAELRDRFLEEQKELLEIAKTLL